MNELSSTLHELNDRGLVLSRAAFAEDALGLFLAAFLVPTAAISQLLDGFNEPFIEH